MLRPICVFTLTGILIAQAAHVSGATFDKGGNGVKSSKAIALPQPRTAGAMSLEETLQKRRSVRDFRKMPVSLEDVSQLLWAAQGITHGEGRRTAPSAGALYPLELYLLAGDVRDLPAGIYRYVTHQHHLEPVRAGQFRADISAAALHQNWIEDGAVILVFAAVEARTTGKYGDRGIRYIYMEAGHAAQNALLQSVALGLGGTPVGAFDEEQVAKTLGLPQGEKVLSLLPIGKPR